MRILFLLIGSLASTAIPVSAQISVDDALRMCQNEIRQRASGSISPANIEFRSLHADQSQGPQGNIGGTFVSGSANTHTFACSVNLAAGKLEWARIDDQAVSTGPVASAERAAGATTQSDLCLRAVRQKVRDHGYIALSLSATSVNETSGTVTGTATGETGGHKNTFQFSCEVNRSTGSVDSVKLDGH